METRGPITHPAEIGALSILPRGGWRGRNRQESHGPDGRFQYKGYPRRLRSSPRSHHHETQRRPLASVRRAHGGRLPL
jgi:hypothetical protein